MTNPFEYVPSTDRPLSHAAPPPDTTYRDIDSTLDAHRAQCQRGDECELTRFLVERMGAKETVVPAATVIPFRIEGRANTSR